MVEIKGFRPEPDSPKHWGFEDKLRAKLVVPSSLGDVDLRPFTSPRHNQGGTGSCVAQATVKAFEIKRIQKYGHEAHVDLSRLAIYWFARNLMVPKETHLDDGTYISHAFDAMRRFGCPPESAHPWDPRRIFEAPSWDAMRKAYLSKIDSFYKIRSTGNKRVEMVMEALAAGNPVVYGTNVDGSWNSYSKGKVLKPVSDDDRTGRHATVILGYKDGLFICENSWGTSWGDDGFYLADPTLIASDTSRDFWVPIAGWERFDEKATNG